MRHKTRQMRHRTRQNETQRRSIDRGNGVQFSLRKTEVDSIKRQKE